MHKNFFLYSFIALILSCSSPSFARVSYTELMVEGDFDLLIENLSKEKDLNKLFADEAVVFMHSLIMEGKIAESKEYIDYYYERFPKDTEILRLKQEIDLFALKFDQDIYTKNQKQHIKYIRTDFKTLKLSSEEKKILLDEILNIENEFYLPSKYDYAFALNEPNFFSAIESKALEEISSKQKILFTKTKDFYQLALAYKALATIQIYGDKLDQAKRFIKLAQSNIFRMRSIWLIEDIKVYHPILKIDEKSTRFASLYPQYLIQLREEFDSYLF